MLWIEDPPVPVHLPDLRILPSKIAIGRSARLSTTDCLVGFFLLWPFFFFPKPLFFRRVFFLPAVDSPIVVITSPTGGALCPTGKISISIDLVIYRVGGGKLALEFFVTWAFGTP